MKSALITGATGGFGPTIAQHLASKGYQLLLHGRNQEKLDKLALNLTPSKCLTLIANPLSSKTAAQELSYSILSSNALPNIIIHHLGGTLGVKSALASPQEWLSVLTMNVLFSAEINRILVPHLIKTDEPARIIHISSISAISLRGSAPYASCKALLNAYVVTLAREIAKTKIVVSAIMPGAFVTPGSNWGTYLEEDPLLVDDFLKHHHACNRLGQPEEILPALDFLADFGNTFAQGCILNIDGGTM